MDLFCVDKWKIVHETGLIPEAEMTEHLGAERYERTETRQAYRNGYRARRLSTRVGTLTLRVPQSRDGSFSTELFSRYQRSEQALVLALMEMVLQGVSTRKVKKITEELCGTSFSKSTVSRLCQGLDARVKAWQERPLDGTKYPFVIVRALVVKVRRKYRSAALTRPRWSSETIRSTPESPRCFKLRKKTDQLASDSLSPRCKPSTSR